MSKVFEIPEGFELTSFTGYKLIPQPDKVQPTWFGLSEKKIPQAPNRVFVEETTFPAYDLQNFDSFTIECFGEFELAGVYLYTTSSEYGSIRTWAVAYLQLIGALGQTWAVNKLGFKLNPEITTPRLLEWRTYEKKSGKDVEPEKTKVLLEFPSREVLQTTVRSLELGDAVVIAKLSG